MTSYNTQTFPAPLVFLSGDGLATPRELLEKHYLPLLVWRWHKDSTSTRDDSPLQWLTQNEQYNIFFQYTPRWQLAPGRDSSPDKHRTVPTCFAFLGTPCDWLKNFASYSHQGKVKSRYRIIRVFPRQVLILCHDGLIFSLVSVVSANQR